MTWRTIQQILDLAIQRLQAGRLQEAEQLYRQIRGRGKRWGYVEIDKMISVQGAWLRP